MDVDIALLTKCSREVAKKYYQVVNFVCLPYDEFEEKKDWYSYFMNIAREGQVLYGERALLKSWV